MRTRLAFALGCLALTACRTPPATVTHKASASPSPVSSPAPTSTPTAAPSGSPTPKPAVITTLKPPTEAFVELSGTVLADPTFLVAAGGAKILANNGSNVLALGDAGLLGSDGNRVAATTGGSAIISDAGAFLAAGDAGLISNNGSNIISDHGGGYGLLDTPTLLPVGGFTVSAVSLKTRSYVPIGRDDAGKPVFTIYSDAAGRYKLYVDAAERANLVVVANVPKKREASLVYNAIAPAAGGTVQVGDDASNGTRLARAILADQLAAILTAQDVDTALAAIGNSADFLTPATRPLIAGLVTALSGAARDHKVPTGTGAQDLPEVHTLATLLADRILADLPYDQLHLGPPFAPTWTGPHEQVYDAIEGAMGVLREAAGRYFDAKHATPPVEITFPRFVQLGAPTNLCTFQERVRLQRPVDACTFVVDDLLSRSQGHLTSNTAAVFAALATQDTPGVTHLDQLAPGDPEYYLDPVEHKPHAASQRLIAAVNSLLGAFALALAPDADGKPSDELAGLLQVLATYADAHAFKGTPSTRPALGLGTPCVPTPTP